MYILLAVVCIVLAVLYNYSTGSGVYSSGSGVYSTGSGVYSTGSGVYCTGSGVYSTGSTRTQSPIARPV